MIGILFLGSVTMQLGALLIFAVFLCCWTFPAEAVIQTRSGALGLVKGYQQLRPPDFTVHKVSLTQKGYIQFLKYVTDVPPLSEYTFCMWVRSNNLTTVHPLLSYSKHEQDRLIRVWIAPFGTDLNLEILGTHIFKFRLQFVENQWYHICQSWSSSQASWNLYMNGKLKANGIAPNLRKVRIKAGGDIVVGQEYTDFDKGLDDGIEGDVFGFNFVAAGTSTYPKYVFPQGHFETEDHHHHHHPKHHNARYWEDVPGELAYFPNEPNRRPKGLMDFGVNILNNMFSYFDPPRPPIKRLQIGSRIVNEIDDDFSPKPTGLRLVELSYNCLLGKGAPLSGRDVIVSWTKTPVRVFGGAILKTVPPFCV